MQTSASANAQRSPGNDQYRFGITNDQLPLSPGCRFVNTHVPKSVLKSQPVSVPALGAPDSSTFTIHGRLCLPPGGAPQGVMLAVPGTSYTNQYWDVGGYQPNTYSFARHMMDAGYAVFAYDELGTGHSSHPPGALVTWDVAAEVTHNIIQQLRAGRIGHHNYQNVLLVGHSSGTQHAWMESAQYNDADAVIGTGWGSTVEVDPGRRFYSSLLRTPAALDPKTAPLVDGDPTYYTSPSRDQNYLYDLSNVDPKMLTYDDNVLRDTTSAGYIATTFNRFKKLLPGGYLNYVPGTSQALGVPTSSKALKELVTKTTQARQSLPLSTHTEDIKIPTFQINDMSDLFFCGPDTKFCNSSQSLQKEESQYFSPQACYRAKVIPHAGQDLNLQHNAQRTFKTIRTFANQVTSPDGSKCGT